MDLVHKWMLDQRSANRFAIACDHIEDTRWEAGLRHQLCQSQGTQHGLLCWLHTTDHYINRLTYHSPKGDMHMYMYAH